MYDTWIMMNIRIFIRITPVLSTDESIYEGVYAGYNRVYRKIDDDVRFRYQGKTSSEDHIWRFITSEHNDLWIGGPEQYTSSTQQLVSLKLPSNEVMNHYITGIDIRGLTNYEFTQCLTNNWILYQTYLLNFYSYY